MDILHNFDRAYELVQRNIEASGCRARLPGVRVTRYISTHAPGTLDLQDLMEADRTEFLQMACHSLLGRLPDQAALQTWQSRTDLSDWAYRRAVIDTLLSEAEVLAGDMVIRGNIYMEDDGEKARAGRSIKQRILSAGIRASRKLPLGIKTPLKKMVMKIMRRQV